MKELLETMTSVFGNVTTGVTAVLGLFTTCVVLELNFGLKFSKAIFGFATKLLHRGR